jgi:HAD superfamily hydrolase (TIGR01509 family)
VKVNWTEVDTVLLDMDGTLLDLHFDNYFWLQHLPRRYAEIHQLPDAEVSDLLVNRFTAEQGSLQWYCTDYWSQQLGLDIVELKREVEHLIASRPFMTEFLQALQTSHRRAILVTNAHRDSMAIKMDKIDFKPLLDEIVVSHDYQRPKEDPEFWQQLMREHPFDPDRTLLIDDTETVLNAAQAFGIGHLLSLSQPDSKGPIRDSMAFPMIHHFDEILPMDPQHG